MPYILKHWRGKLSLAVTLWINVLGLLVVISCVEVYTLSQLAVTPESLIKLSIASLLFTRLIVFSWQLIGLFRAIENDYIDHGNILKTRGLQAITLMLVMGNLVYSLEVVQSAVYNKQQIQLTYRAVDKEEYHLDVSDDKRSLSLTGVITIGITATTRTLLEENPEVTSVILKSPGGHVYEGRGLAKLFIKNQLDTFVYEECSSACATAFIGGRYRLLGPKGKLGFHQYKLDTSGYGKYMFFYNPEAEQKHDLELFRLRGVQKEFREKMYIRTADQIWFPEHKELLEMYVIDGILPSSK